MDGAAPRRAPVRPLQAGRDLLAGLVPLLLVTLAMWGSLGLPASYLAQAGGLYLLLCGLIVRSAPAVPSPRGLGAPNRVTLLRATLILPVAALVLHPAALDALAYWWVVGVSLVALVLDGLDGRVARKMGAATRFGARFDMELDAFLLVVLSVLVWQSGQTGPWILLVGALRYLFVAAGRVWPELRGELPPSRRRQVVCAAQGAVLVACLAPVLPPTLAAGLAAGGLLLLVYSFAVDVWWLTSPVSQGGRARPQRPSPSPS